MPKISDCDVLRRNGNKKDILYISTIHFKCQNSSLQKEKYRHQKEIRTTPGKHLKTIALAPSFPINIERYLTNKNKRGTIWPLSGNLAEEGHK